MENEIEELLIECKNRWGESDENINNFQKDLPLYLGKLSLQMREIILLLLNYFDYYSHKHVNTYLKELHHKLMQRENIDFGNSVFCVLKSQRGTINSSYEYLIEYRHLNGIAKYSIVPELNDIAQKYWGNIDNVILIDDFCGSGKTFMDYVSKNINLLIGKYIVYIVIHIMEEAISKIQSYADEKKIIVDIIYKKSKCCVFNF